MSNKSKDADPKQPDSSFIQFDDAKQQGAASAASASRRKALLGVLAAACTILIVVSLGFVHPSESGAWSIDWIVQTVTGRASSPRTPRGLARLPLRARLVPRIPNLRMMQKTSPRVRTTPRTIPSLQTRNRTKTRIARSPRTGAARSLAINPLPKIREPVILPMRLAVLLRAVASRLMEPHPLMVEMPPRAAKAAHRSPTTLR